MKNRKLIPIVFFALIGFALPAHAQLTENQITASLDQISAQVRSGAYSSAMPNVFRLLVELRRRVGPGKIAESQPAGQLLTDPNSIVAEINVMRTNLQNKQDEAALKTWLRVGISINALADQASPKPIPMPLASSGKVTATEVAQRAKEAYRNKDFVQAQLLANEIVSMKLNMASLRLFHQPLHSAYTVLGLISMNDGNIQQAKQYLMLSVENRSDPSFTGWLPNFALADKLWRAGETTIVSEYVSICAGVDYLSAKDKAEIVDRDQKIKAGKFTSFGFLADSIR